MSGLPSWDSVGPPSFPTPAQYASCYCEENVYRLVEQLSEEARRLNAAAHRFRDRKRGANVFASENVFMPVWDVRAVFISNDTRSVLLWQQRASKVPEAGHPVVWDYHVVAAVTATLVPFSHITRKQSTKAEHSRTWIYDADSRLCRDAKPVLLETYTDETFSPLTVKAGRVPPHLRSAFRVVDANLFLAHFASDRSHMRTKDGWAAEPPAWPVIAGSSAGSTNNLFKCYVSMLPNAAIYGRTLQDTAFFQAQWTKHDKEAGETVVQAPVSGVSSVPTTPVRENSKPPKLRRSTSYNDSLTSDGKRGGRIASPLFPAYLAASSTYRAHKAAQPPPPPAL